jgi:iron complex outermembrane receptor protein/vitamin B12 transporter
VTGRAILDFGGTYPSRFDSRTTRRALSGQTTYTVNALLSVSAGARYEREEGFDDPGGDPIATRNNGGVFGEVRLTLMNRHYVTGGVGLEHNAAFGEAVTPRISIASYLRQPSATGSGGTRLVLNAGSGIKAPSAFQAASSVHQLVQGTPAANGIDPIGPERSHSFDLGIEQGLLRSSARVRLSYFHNTFFELIEFSNRSGLVRAGVPPEVANASGSGGYVNSQSYRAQGIELSFEAAPIRDLRVMASYTRLEAEVTKAFGASESFNPLFPGIRIGAFSPLVGERPFRRPANSGSFMVTYAPGKASVTLSAYLSGTRDDSTFLSDQFFGNSMLLPNRDLEKAYQKVDLSGSYRFHRRAAGYVSIENLFDQEYEPAFGYPALPITARAGFRLTFGGDSSLP